ncbi:IS1380 family transposase [uncultured Roseibium sp.]|uniref:IS1380 family transposase n=1 Tax=uncultured Roseibium sp. TaxID=1936171 RepID=UPI003216B67C
MSDFRGDVAGESISAPLKVGFDRRLKLQFHGAKLSSDGGLFLFRELDDDLGLTGMASWELRDNRTGRNARHDLLAMFRQSLFGRVAGYEDVNDAGRLSRDPVMRLIAGQRDFDRFAASESQMGRFETNTLALQKNLAALADLSGKWIDRVRQLRKRPNLILDIDSSESPVHGSQEGSAYNGHFGCNCYHPLFVFNQFGDLERCALRPGNVHSAHDWQALLDPVVKRYRWSGLWRKYFRADAAFAIPELFDYLEANEFGYAIRLRANKVLQRRIAWLLKRRPGRPSNNVERHYANFTYQANSWSKPRRVVAKVEWHPGELFPRVGFVVTTLTVSDERVYEFYNLRGTAEQYIKEGKHALKWTRLSCQTFKANAVRLQLHALAYNLSNFLRTLVLPNSIADWSLTSLRDRMIKIGAKAIQHARSIILQLAEVAVPRGLWSQMLATIAALKAKAQAP